MMNVAIDAGVVSDLRITPLFSFIPVSQELKMGDKSKENHKLMSGETGADESIEGKNFIIPAISN